MGRAFEVRKASMMKTGIAKTKIYTKHSKEIYMCAKSGGADLESNLNLKHVVDKAKKNNVPADVISRAIDKAKDSKEDNYQSVRYEGFGPDGSTIIVDCLTDNVNRTVSEVKNCFTKTGCKIGAIGSVSHLYNTYGIIELELIDEDTLLELLIDNDIECEDIETTDVSVIYVTPNDLHKTLVVLDKYTILNQEIAMLPQIESELSPESVEIFSKLLSMLNDASDVQEIYHSVINI